MDIAAIVTALKARTTATFASRIAGAAEYKRLPETANLVMPAAYVIPLDDNAEPQSSENGYSQIVRDSFMVIVAVSNTADERGQAGYTSVAAIRATLWAALLAWNPSATHGPIQYEGGALLDMDRARLYYQFEFSAATEIVEADTWQATANAALGAFETLHIDVDTIDPFDPNRVAAGERGPDGTIDAALTLSIPQ
jgi:hypothetical protein